MFGWLRWLARLIWGPRDPKGLVVHEYGRYVHRPVIQRALAKVMGITQGELVGLIKREEIILNGDPLDLTHLVLRMESGDYEIKQPTQNKVWRFFIG